MFALMDSYHELMGMFDTREEAEAVIDRLGPLVGEGMYVVPLKA